MPTPKSDMTGIQMTVFPCRWCGKSLPDGRADLIYHPNCKQAAYKWRRKATRYASDMSKCGVDLVAYMQYPEMRDRAKDLLEEHITTLLRSAKAYGITLKCIR